MDEKKLLENISNAISKRMTHKKFAELLGISEHDLKNRTSGKTKLKSVEIIQYASLLQIDPASFFHEDETVDGVNDTTPGYYTNNEYFNHLKQEILFLRQLILKCQPNEKGNSNYALGNDADGIGPETK